MPAPADPHAPETGRCFCTHPNRAGELEFDFDLTYTWPHIDTVANESYEANLGVRPFSDSVADLAKSSKR